MTSHIDFRTLPNNVPSLCIPRVFPNWNESRIRRVFDELRMGDIDRVDIVSKTTEKGEKFNRVFIHFRRWFTNENADAARERLLNGRDIKIIYDDPWFWKVSAYRSSDKEPSDRDRQDRGKRPTIQLDDKPRRRDNSRERPRRDEDVQRRPRNDDRRPRYDDRRPRDDDRRPSSKASENKSKEFLDKQLEDLNPTIRKVHTPDPFVHTPDIAVKPELAVHYATDSVVNEDQGLIINYGDVQIPIKRRKITIKKPEPKKVPLVVEEGEVVDNSDDSNGV